MMRAVLALVAFVAPASGCEEPCGMTNPGRCEPGEACVSPDGGPARCAPYCGDASVCPANQACKSLPVADTSFRIDAFVCVVE